VVYRVGFLFFFSKSGSLLLGPCVSFSFRFAKREMEKWILMKFFSSDVEQYRVYFLAFHFSSYSLPMLFSCNPFISYLVFLPPWTCCLERSGYGGTVNFLYGVRGRGRGRVWETNEMEMIGDDERLKKKGGGG